MSTSFYNRESSRRPDSPLAAVAASLRAPQENHKSTRACPEEVTAEMVGLTFEHRRGRSAEHEYNLIDDFLVIIAIAGAQMAPSHMKVDTCDLGSSIKLPEDETTADQDTILIAQYPVLRSISAQIRRVGQRAKLDGYGARLFMDAIIADATNCLVQGCTVTAALENDRRGHYEMQAGRGCRSSGRKRSRRSRSVSSSSAESDEEDSSSGSARRYAHIITSYSCSLISPDPPTNTGQAATLNLQEEGEDVGQEQDQKETSSEEDSFEEELAARRPLP
ncbi:MAG: hypothetical protein SGPRY_006895 [Prymnesium sp.]